MRRREFIGLIGSAAVAWPFAAYTQQAGRPVVGFMSSPSPEDSVHLLAAFRQGLDETGFIEGQNVAIEFRWAQGRVRSAIGACGRSSQPPGRGVGGGRRGASALAAKKQSRRSQPCLSRPIQHRHRAWHCRSWQQNPEATTLAYITAKAEGDFKTWNTDRQTGGQFRTGLRQTTRSRSQHRQRWAVESR